MLGDYEDGDAGYLVEEASDDDDNSCSSEDEFEACLQKMLRDPADHSSEDDFEAEMDKELSSHVRSLEEKTILKLDKSKRKDDSDVLEDNPESVSEKAGKPSSEDNQKPSNDDLFYDPNLDDEDQQWVNEQRRAYLFPPTSTAASNPNKTVPLPNSDAVLNCPACLTVLCMDCQRHEIYHHQYRAMFVANCNVDYTQVLTYPRKGKRRPAQNSPQNHLASKGDSYHPVKCNICNTEVAVYDSEEVYHFFNIVASFA